MSDLATPPIQTSALPLLLLSYIGLPAIALLLNKPEIAKAIVATEAGGWIHRQSVRQQYRQSRYRSH
jgi:hypothetical protein